MKKTNLLSLILTLVCINLSASEQAASANSSVGGKPVVPQLQLQSAAGTVSPIAIPLSASSMRSSQNGGNGALSPASPQPATPGIAAALAPLGSDSAAGKQKDEKHAAETGDQLDVDQHVAVTQNCLLKLERHQPGLGASAAFDAFHSMDEQASSNHHMRVNYSLYAHTITGMNPSAPMEPRVVSRPRRAIPGITADAESLMQQNYLKRLLASISRMPQRDGTLDLTPLEDAVITHHSRELESANAKMKFDASQAPKATSLKLDQTNAEVKAMRAQLQEDLYPVVAEELRDEQTRKALIKKMKPKVREELRTEFTPVVKKQLDAEMRAKQQRSQYLTYAACFGAGCALTGLGVWAYNAFGGKKPTQAQQK